MTRRPVGTIGGERARSGGRLGGSVRHHAQPSAISNPHLPLPRRDRQPATLGRIIIYFPFISFSELHSYLSLSLFRPPPSAVSSAANARALCFSLLDSRRKRYLASRSLYRGTEIKEFTVVFVGRFLQGSANSTLQLFFA